MGRSAEVYCLLRKRKLSIAYDSEVIVLGLSRDIFAGKKSIYGTLLHILFIRRCPRVKYRDPKYDSSQRLIYSNRKRAV